MWSAPIEQRRIVYFFSTKNRQNTLVRMSLVEIERDSP
jgi:hypothetical protein